MGHSQPPRPHGLEAIAGGDTGRSASRRQLAWMTALLIAASGCAVGAAIFYLRGEAVRAGEQLSTSLAHVIEEQTTRTIQTADQQLQLAATRLQAMSAAGGLNEESARDMLREGLVGIPFIRALWVLDGSGRVAYGSEPGNIGMQAGDREYFRVYRERPSAGFHVSAPTRSRVTNEWQINASLPLRNGSGTLTGVVVAALDPRYFDRLWREIELGSGGAIALFRRDGIVMMRSPIDDGAMGRDLSGLAFFRELLPRSDHGIYATTSAFDARPRLVAYRALSSYPELVVNVGRAQEDILGPWRRLSALALGIWLSAAAMLTLLSVLLYRQSQHRERTELRFAQLAQAMPQIVFIADPGGRLTFVSNQWTQVTGLPVESALSGNWLEWVHPDDREATTDNIRHVRATAEPIANEHRLLCRDGVYRWQLARAMPNRDAGGKILSWYGTFTDIDDLKQAEVALKAQSELITMAGKLSRLAGWSLDVKTGGLLWSDEAAEILELPPGSAPTLETALDLCAPDDREKVAAALQACMEAGTPFEMDMEMLTPAGNSVWIRSLGQAVRDEPGAIVRVQGAFQDISSRVAAEREIRIHLQTLQRLTEAALAISRHQSMEALLQEVVDQARSIIGAHHAVASITRSNGATHVITADSRSQEYAQGRARVDGQLAVPLTARDGGNPGHLRLADKFRGEFTLRDEFVATELAHLASVALDNLGLLAQVTELNAGLEEKIARRTAELQVSNAELEAFSYSVSHDLRSPLSTVDGFSRLLQKELDGDHGPKVSHYMSRIQAGVHHMGQLIDGLLSLAQVSRASLRHATVDLSALATEVLERLQNQDADRAVAWSVEPGLSATGDGRLLRSVLDNLLGNAWKFTARRQPAEISVGWSAPLGAFFVRDNGAGFDMAYADKLFGTFQRLHDASQFPGTGVGLATVARVIARHGGRIWAESAPDAGATFYFTLPAAP